MWVLFELFCISSYIGKWILLTWLNLSVAGQKQNFKIDVMISLIFTTAFTSNISKIYFF